MPSYCLCSTYPPTRCGLATFSASLVHALSAGSTGDRAGVVRVVEGRVSTARPEVLGHLHTGTADGIIEAATELNAHDLAIVQHEYGIFGGTDGDELLALLDLVRVPVIVVLHTVLAKPTPHQRHVLERVTAAAGAVVVMTGTARGPVGRRLRRRPGRTSPSFRTALTENPSRPSMSNDRRPTILTWGLLGPGKGIEWGFWSGLHELRLMHPRPRYVIAGETHPKVRRQQGEAYRIGLATRARAARPDRLGAVRTRVPRRRGR